MTTWWRGRFELSKIMETGTLPDELFLADLGETPLPRVPGTAVFMSSGTDGMPNVLLHHVKHNKVLHKQVVLLSVVTENVPFVVGNTLARSVARARPRLLPRASRASASCSSRTCPKILARCEKHGLVVERRRHDLLPRPPDAARRRGKARVARWRKMLFAFLSRNARPPTAFFNLPPNRVVELGLQIEL